MIGMFVHIVECYVDLLLSSLRACAGFECGTVKPDPAFLFKLFCGEGQSIPVWKGASSSWILFFTSTTVSQLGANIASREVNTTTFDSTDCSVSTCSLVWEDRPLSKFSCGTGSPTYQRALLHDSEKWCQSGSPFFLATSKSPTISWLRCGAAFFSHCHRPPSFGASFRIEHAVLQLRYRSSDACAKNWICWFALHVTSNL